MKLNKFQAAFILPITILISILITGFISDQVKVNFTVIGIILSLFLPFIIFSKKLVNHQDLKKSKQLWLLNIYFIIDWFVMSWLFYRESSDVTFISFYDNLIQALDGFTAVVLLGLIYCLGLINFGLFNINKQINDNVNTQQSKR
ncbi:hypothetical protein DAY19_14335 [Halobacteriovorax vibrionivorans]|uniref:Uncharacterized protein n=1 Tax=Halobacteriovorax vibrionivorans TaxID=2152716 RepID=A0ABY0IDW3_9BACT|nr:MULTISPECIES: hypothetical protein [Halobacteriovorax]RZF21152.1 hypothetical protein DAY19_14335 [Halobacteriovorax vibrionivorans]TGD46251.1 hypothetical protein EP118_12680 [Halobacteriovorax sp. Y22]